MNTSSSIIGIGTVAVLVLAWLFYLIWINRESDQAWSLIFQVLIPLLAACGLLLSSILSPLPEDSADIQVLILHDKNQELAPLMGPLFLTDSSHAYGYCWLGNVLTGWQYKQKDKNAKNEEVLQYPQDEFFLDLLEKTFWFWLAQKYGLHWMVEHYWFQGISGGGGYKHQALDAEKFVYTLHAQDIAKFLSGNRFASSESMLGDVKFPVGSEVTINRQEGGRLMEVHNKHLDLKIAFESAGRGELGATILAEKIKSKMTTASPPWWEEHIKVSFYCKYNKWRRWSPSTKRQKKWLQDMISMFRNDFEWPLIKNDLEKAFDIMK